MVSAGGVGRGAGLVDSRAVAATDRAIGKGTDFTLVLTDSTQGWSYIVNKTLSNPALASAEVIAEAPSSGSGVLPLTNYGTVNFTAADANGASMAGQSPDPTTMASGSTTKATVSSIFSSRAFSDTWHHN
ncbi:G1 family glutamic endopeptidase [Catenulispora acidiphila]|nr:G1 family glutamic endopeptidase [Catenulispora acidiphila]